MARPIQAKEVGSRTTLSVRPERLQINPDGVDYPNRLTGEVVEVIYFGDHRRVRIALADTDDFTAKVAISPSSRDLQPGEAVEVGWAPQHCRALDPT